MKPIWLVGTALIVLAALAPVAQAQRVSFAYTGQLVTWTLPATGLYRITAYGAQGGNDISESVVGSGGLGAEIGGDFTLTVGEAIAVEIAVGGKGSDYNFGGGGGGGGSFVVGSHNTPLVIASGGGGGGGTYGEEQAEPLQGGGGLTSENGGGGVGSGYNGGGRGGTNGNGGAAGSGDFENGCCYGGGGGGGFLSAGGNAFAGGTGGASFPSLAGGTSGGGFGGGGGAFAGAGGGGGYSGGGGGLSVPDGLGSGGGGGSYDGGTNQMLVADIQAGDGEVVIETIFVGTPGKPNCHGEVVSNLAKQYGGLDAAAAALGYSSVQVLQNGIATYCAGSIG